MRVPQSVLPLFLLGVASGCASVSPPPEGPAPNADSLAAVRAAVADRPPLPDRSDLLPDAELVTFLFRSDGESRRDTVRGAARVSSWLEQLASRTAGSSAPFQLERREILVCDGAAVERGEYALGGMAEEPGLGSRATRTRLQYLALWRPSGETWKLERIYLSPAPAVRPNRLADGCTGEAPRLPTVSLGAGLGGGGGADFETLRSYPIQTDVTGARPGLRAWARFATLNGVFVVVEYFGGLGGRLNANDGPTIIIRRAQLDVLVHTVAVSAEATFGPLSLSAGPVIATGRSRFTVLSESRGVTEVDGKEVFVQVGGVMARSSVRIPLGEHFRAFGTVGYAHIPDIVLTDPVETTVGLPPWNGFLGIEWVP